MLGEVKYLYFVALTIGFSFHLHFTAIFYVIIVLVCSPYILTRKDGLKHAIFALPVFFFWFIPNVISEMQKKFTATNSMTSYLSVYYHGLHLVRVRQLIKDAVIEFEAILFFKQLKPLAQPLPIIFLVVVWFKEKVGKNIIISITALWYLVPLFVLSTYKGEITNYYFSITRPSTVVILAYLLNILFVKRLWPIAVLLSVFFIYFSYANIQKYITTAYPMLPKERTRVIEAIQHGNKIEFQEGVPESYIYYLYHDVQKRKL